MRRRDNRSTEASDFASFHREQRDRLVRALALSLGSATLAAEAADEAMVRAYERWATVSTLANPSGWAYRVGLNWARSWWRRHRSHEVEQTRDHPMVEDGSHIDLRSALAGLDAGHRDVVLLRHLLGLSTEETADVLGISAGTVKSRLSRARQRLQTAMEVDHV